MQLEVTIRQDEQPLMGASEAALALGVSQTNLRVLSGLPEPFQVLAMGSVWLTQDIAEFRERRRLRPPKPGPKSTTGIEPKQEARTSQAPSAGISPVEYQAQLDWLRSNPHGPLAESVKRELRAWDRELESQGVTIEAWLASTRTRLGLSTWYVAIFHDRPGKPLASRCRHRDRYCQHIVNIGNEDVREATEDELDRLGPCATCG